PSKPLPVDIEALQALKFESEDPDESARSYKEEGNYHFKRREFQSAKENYTEGLKSGCKHSEMLAVLYTNRAAADFHLKNYGSCYKDCAKAKQLKPDHYRAHERGARALLSLERHADCAAWCDEALNRWVADPELLRLSSQARAVAEASAAKARREAAVGRRAERQLAGVAAALARRGVQIRPGTGRLEMPDDAKVEFAAGDADGNGVLRYPVLLLYPEFGQTDFLRGVDETASLAEVAATVFDPSQPPAAWNSAKAYNPDSALFYLDCSSISDSAATSKAKPETLDKRLTLAQVLKRPEAALTGSVLLLTVLRAGPYHDRWLKEWWDSQ
ncbi:hypothetical protein BOX15_Mlig020912g1, partial [Macrostomum lignano]